VSGKEFTYELNPLVSLYTQSNKNASVWYFVCPAQAVTCGIVAIIIQVIFLSPYLDIHGVSPSSIHYNQSHCIYIEHVLPVAFGNKLCWFESHYQHISLCSPGS